jgi:hypothetical protein
VLVLERLTVSLVLGQAFLEIGDLLLKLGVQQRGALPR